MTTVPFSAPAELFRPTSRGDAPSSNRGNWPGDPARTPPADVVESPSEIQVLVELPGVQPQHVYLELEDNVLTIRGEKSAGPADGERGRWHLRERQYGVYSRFFVLPRDVDPERIRAGFDNGLLTVAIPKSERVRRRRIEVGASESR